MPNDSDKTISFRVGSNFLLIITLTLITLKAFSILNWPWWLILLPLYGTFGLQILFFLATITIAALIGLGAYLDRKNNRPLAN